jgi:hypothetical protein
MDNKYAIPPDHCLRLEIWRKGTDNQATRAFIDRYLKEDLESIACPTISGKYPF